LSRPRTCARTRRSPSAPRSAPPPLRPPGGSLRRAPALRARQGVSRVHAPRHRSVLNHQGRARLRDSVVGDGVVCCQGVARYPAQGTSAAPHTRAVLAVGPAPRPRRRRAHWQTLPRTARFLSCAGARRRSRRRTRTRTSCRRRRCASTSPTPSTTAGPSCRTPTTTRSRRRAPEPPAPPARALPAVGSQTPGSLAWHGMRTFI